MAKTTGMGAAFYIDGYDLSGDIGSLSRISSTRGVTEVPGIDVSAQERLHVHKDGGLEYSAWFNPTTGQSHPVLSVIPSTDRHAMYLHRATLGAPAAACVAKQTDFSPNRPADGSFTLGVTVESNAYGLEWGDMLTAGKQTDTAAGNGTGVDLLASTAFGLQAYLQVFSFTGTSVTVTIQESSDNGVGDAWAAVTGGAFTAATARGTQRIQTARGQTVERYLRVATTGTFTSAVFAVMVVKNPVSVVF